MVQSMLADVRKKLKTLVDFWDMKAFVERELLLKLMNRRNFIFQEDSFEVKCDRMSRLCVKGSFVFEVLDEEFLADFRKKNFAIFWIIENHIDDRWEEQFLKHRVGEEKLERKVS